MGFWDAVAFAGPYANSLHLHTDNHTSSSSLDFYRPDAVPDAQPTVSKHWCASTAHQSANAALVSKYVAFYFCMLTHAVTDGWQNTCRSKLIIKKQTPHMLKHSRSSAITDWLRDVKCQSNSCQLQHNSVGTTCTTGTWHCSDRQYSDRHCSDRHCSDRQYSDRQCSDKRYPWALYTVSQKNRHQSLTHNFTKYLLIFTILSLLDSVVNL